MKLLSCHISGFGNLKDDFSFNALTSVYAKNGWGKTTLAAFIRAMFYGLAPTKTNSVKYDDRRRYLPFDNSRFGGSLTFEHDGKKYTIERYFDEKSGKGDTLKLFEGNDEVEVGENSLGQTFLGVDEKTFSRTLFINGDELSNLSDIGSALSNVVDDTDNGTFEKALKKLDEELTSLKAKRGKGGRINVLQEEIFDLENRRQHLLNLSNIYNEKSGEYERIKAERDGLTLSFKSAGIEERWAIYDGMIADIASVKEKIDRIMSHYPSGTVSVENQSKLDALCRSYRDNQVKIDSIEERLNVRGEKRAWTASDYVVLFSWIFAAVFIVLGAVYAVMQNLTLAIIFWSICLFFGILARIIPMTRKSNLSRLKQEQKRLMHYGELLLSGYGLHGDMLEWAAKIKSDLSELKNAERELEIRQDGAEKFKIDKGLSERDKPKLNLSVSDADKNARFEDIDRRLIELNSELSLMERELEGLDSVLNELSEKREELQRVIENYRLLSAAFDGLKSSEAKLKDKFVNPVYNSFKKYATLINKSLGIKANLTTKLEMVVEESGSIRRCEHLSKGQLSVLSLALRLALTDNLYKNAFIVMDDPFINLDEEYLDKVKELLLELKKERQIIYLTCHKSRMI